MFQPQGLKLLISCLKVAEVGDVNPAPRYSPS